MVTAARRSATATILLLELLQAARLTDLHAAVLRLPGVVRPRRDPVPADHLADHGASRGGLLQDRDDLFFDVPLASACRGPSLGLRLAEDW